MTNLRNIYILKGYNNYFNRIVKKHATVDEYIANSSGYEIFTNINFNPNDGVITSQVLNCSEEDAKCDYLLVVNFDNYNDATEDQYVIESRWFITEAVRNRGNQYTFNLKRDVIVDNYDEVIKAPCYIEKASARRDNPLILNSEGMSFNQIKADEKYLYDESNTGWIVGYLARDFNPTPQASDKIDIISYESARADYNLTTAQIETLISTYSDFNATPDKYEYLTYFKNPANNVYVENISYYASNDRLTQTVSLGPSLYGTLIKSVGQEVYNYNNLQYTIYGVNEEMDSLAAIQGITFADLDDTEELLKYDNKYVLDTTANKLYKFKIIKESKTFKREIGTATVGDLLFSYRNEGVTRSGERSADIIGNIYYDNYKLIIEQQQTAASINLKAPANRTHLIDAPYDMFCIPYSSIEVYDNGETYTPSREINIATAVAIMEKASTAGYDLQLLPYCPIRETFKIDPNTDNCRIDVTYIVKDAIVSEGDTVGFIYWCNRSQSSFVLKDYTFEPYNIDKLSDASNEDYKIANEVDLYRLSSPNYASGFDFNPTKNNGVVNYFEVDFSYKPFTPYIHLTPHFEDGGLYGKDYEPNDARGLICSGDFSLPSIRSAWETYELQNKNYQQMFDRQIQNLEVKQEYQRVNQIAGAIGGALGTGIGAGIVSGNAGLGVGAGAVSGAAGVADIIMSERLRTEEKQYSIDMYNYNLQNIQAIPNTLTKVSAFNPNNRVVPILEYYTCTAKEKESLRNKLIYNGMTIMDLATISDYINETPTYIKGDIVRLPNIEEDTHMLNAIYAEIKKGVFI